MKIALVVTGGLHPSGSEQIIPALLAFVMRLAEHHNVHAFALRHLSTPQRYTLGRATIHDLGRPPGRFRQWRALTTALVESGPFDVVHGYWGDPSGLLAAIAGKQLHVPSVVSCVSGEFVALPDIAYGLQRTVRGRAFMSATCRLATVVHVISDYMRALATQHGVDAVCIPLGIDTQRFAAGGGKRGGPPWRLLQVASMNRVKDQSTLLRTLARLRQTSDVCLDIVGEDTLDGHLQREASALGIADAVTFRGFLPQHDVAALYRDADVYVQSSRHEAGGIAVLEAAAAGLPIVGTRVGYVSDWDDTAAIGVTPGSSDDLAAAILSVLNDAQRRNALAAAARARARQYDVVDTTRRMGDLYAALAASKAAQ